MVSMGIVKRCPIGLGLSSILAYRAWVSMTYAATAGRRTILQRHPSPPRCCLISLTLSLPVTTQTLLHLSSRSLPSILCRHSSPTHITENLWLWLADLIDCRSLPFTPSPCSFLRHLPRHSVTIDIIRIPGNSHLNLRYRLTATTSSSLRHVMVPILSRRHVRSQSKTRHRYEAR